MNAKIGGLLLAMSIIGLTGCGQKEIETASETTEATTESSTDAAVTEGSTAESEPSGDSEAYLEFVSGGETEETKEAEAAAGASLDWYENIKSASLLSEGTNGRLDTFIKKLMQGEEVTVVAIGGSVTEGAGAGSFDKSYADKFVQGLEAEYPDATVNYLNVGFSGTPSSLGVIRYDHDVTEKLETNPDLVIIEFAVNDWQEETNSRAYESMIKTILEKDEDTAVVLMFAVFRNKWNLEELYTDMGYQYGLPMVSAKQGTKDAFAAGNLTDSQFFFDEYHPTAFGHTVMSDALLYLVDQKKNNLVEKTEIDFSNPVKGTDFTNMHMLESTSTDVKITAGGFSSSDTEIQGFQRTGEAEFANNWMHTAESGSKSFQVTLNCKNILLDYKTSNKDTFGKAEIYVDGELVREVDGYSAGGWNNSNIILILDETEVKKHTLEVKMAEDSMDKNFTIYTIGYTD